MRSLVVYYSWTGSTREAAQAVSEAVEGELLEITETKSRRGIFGFIKGGFQASTGKASRIMETLPDPQGYDAIFVGTPVWASKPSAAFNAVIEEWAGKTGDVPVHIFALMADPNGNPEVETAVRKELQEAGIRLGACAVFTGKAPNKEWSGQARDKAREAAAQWAAEAAK
jgi:flavodoxin